MQTSIHRKSLTKLLEQKDKRLHEAHDAVASASWAGEEFSRTRVVAVWKADSPPVPLVEQMQFHLPHPMSRWMCLRTKRRIQWLDRASPCLLLLLGLYGGYLVCRRAVLCNENGMKRACEWVLRTIIFRCFSFRDTGFSFVPSIERSWLRSRSLMSKWY